MEAIVPFNHLSRTEVDASAKIDSKIEDNKLIKTELFPWPRKC